METIIRSHKELVKKVVNCKVCMKMIRKHLASILGSKTSDKKAKSSRINRKLGGRPKIK